MICQICKNHFKNFLSLVHHVIQTHKISNKDYYDKFLKKENLKEVLD